ncbi:MAG: FHA domain-containing protein, partial [Candidatus Methylacidiphilales bacterium]
MIFKLRHQKTQQAIPVPPGSHVIGRDDQADLRFEDISISRRHARLTNENNLILVEDLGSSNGTTIKGQKITAPVELKFGDVVDFGNASFRIEPEVVGEISAPPPALKRAMVPAPEKKLNRQTAKLDLPPASGDIPRARAAVMPDVQPVVVPKASSRRIDLPPAGESGPVFSPKPASTPAARPASVSAKAGATLSPVPSRMEALSPKVSGPMPVMTKSTPPAPVPRPAPAPVAVPQQPEEDDYVPEELAPAPIPAEARRSAPLPAAPAAAPVPVPIAAAPAPLPALSPLAVPGLNSDKNPFAVASQSRKEASAAQLAHAPQVPVNEANAPSLVNMLPSAQPKQGWMNERQALPIWVNFILAFG